MQVPFVNLPNNNFIYSIQRLNFHTQYSLSLINYMLLLTPNVVQLAFFKGTTRDFAVTNQRKTFPLLERDFK